MSTFRENIQCWIWLYYFIESINELHSHLICVWSATNSCQLIVSHTTKCRFLLWLTAQLMTPDSNRGSSENCLEQVDKDPDPTFYGCTVPPVECRTYLHSRKEKTRTIKNKTICLVNPKVHLCANFHKTNGKIPSFLLGMLDKASANLDIVQQIWLHGVNATMQLDHMQKY